MEKVADGDDDWPEPTKEGKGAKGGEGGHRRGRRRSPDDGDGDRENDRGKGEGKGERDRAHEHGDGGRPPPPPPPPPGYGGHHAGGGSRPVIAQSSWGPIYKDENLLAGLAMILAAIDFVGLVLALVFLFIWSPMSRWLKYNLYQVIFLSVAIAIIHIIIFGVETAARITHLPSWIFMVVMLVFTLFLGLKYINRQEYDVPVVGDVVKRNFMH